MDGEGAVAFLRALRRQPPAPKTTPRDRGGVHDRSEAVPAYPAGRPAIETERPPSDTPGANPGEGVWGYTEYGRPADFAPEDADALRAALVEEPGRLHRRAEPPGSFIRHAKAPVRLRP